MFSKVNTVQLFSSEQGQWGYRGLHYLTGFHIIISVRAASLIIDGDMSSSLTMIWNQALTCFISISEHFENDVVNTVKSFLEYHPDLNVLIVSNDLPYPPLQLPENAKVKVCIFY